MAFIPKPTGNSELYELSFHYQANGKVDHKAVLKDLEAAFEAKGITSKYHGQDSLSIGKIQLGFQGSARFEGPESLWDKLTGTPTKFHITGSAKDGEMLGGLRGVVEEAMKKYSSVLVIEPPAKK